MKTHLTRPGKDDSTLTMCGVSLTGFLPNYSPRIVDCKRCLAFYKDNEAWYAALLSKDGQAFPVDRTRWLVRVYNNNLGIRNPSFRLAENYFEDEDRANRMAVMHATTSNRYFVSLHKVVEYA